jgi:hypothetical protein
MSSSRVQVDTIATHLGEVVSGEQLTALPLNGRSYTDLLAIQPGVAPISTLLPSSVVMAGATGSLEPSGDLNPGNLSINGQRESSNGFLVDGIDVQEHMNGETSIIPNLDSIDEFRVLTTNFDSEYGNYNGGSSPSSPRVEPTAGTATHSSSFVTPPSMRGDTSIRLALLSSRISLAELWEDLYGVTTLSSSRTIRVRGQRKEFPRGTSLCRPSLKGAVTLAT